MGTTPPGELTPLMKQYWDVKSAHQDKILLFRMGDFFEIFHDDAVTAAPIMGVALTARNKKSGDQTPMCGVPHHSIANHINKLLSHGFKIAICDQVEDPKQAKGLVKRAVTRILSPGMVFDPETLDGHAFNYLCAWDENHVSFLEPTTGECFYYEIREDRERKRLISILAPVEIITTVESESSARALLGDDRVYSVHSQLLNSDSGIESARRLLSYAVHMQGDDILKTLSTFEPREFDSRLQIEADVIRHLEIFRTYKGDVKGTLFDTLNRTLTAGGSRRLRQWMSFPLRQEKKINSRLDEIAGWLAKHDDLKSVRQSLRGVGDLERKMGKISHPNSHPRDLKNLAETFQYIFSILEHFPGHGEIQKKVAYWRSELERLLEDELPLQYRDGGIIRKGVSSELDELIELATNSQGKIGELEARERELTQISSLKIRYNNVFGYYIEVTNTHTSKVPMDRYQRKQTLTNAERYTTDELVQLERKVVSARTRRAELEIEIYQQLKMDLLSEMQSFLKLAQFLNDLDAVTALAWLAFENNYCRPVFSSQGVLNLKASRHPVVEQTVSFVPNDILLIPGECLLLTGPNMAGKSTLMRQVAIAALMAQMGSYVPATQAQLPLYDRIFTRIGASDFLNEGLSTFMVEMKETAVMLKEATPQSLVILDEVGRGTSTYDGLSLAQAILEHLIADRKSMVFFATHYHELTELATAFEQIKNSHMTIHEKNGDLKFLYTLSEGPAVRSYGIQVARLAGLPSAVTKRAEGLLKRLEQATKTVETQALAQLDLWNQPVAETPVVEIDPKADLVLKEMKDSAIQSMTPLEALNKIAKWQQELF